MKRFISLAIAVIMIFALIPITISAADTPKSAYRIDWSELSYNTYWYNQNENDIGSHFTVSKTSNSISFTGKKGNERRSYVATNKVTLSSTTKYEYVFQAKNNRDYGYCGVVFAWAGGVPYFMYGSFNNVSDDPNDGMSDIRVQKGLNQHDSKNCSTGYTRSYRTVELDSDGYGTFKVVFDGYKAIFYGLTDIDKGTYELIGNAITLPSDAKIAFGAFNRENDGSKERTVTIRNAVLYAMNDEAANNISALSDGSYELLAYIAQVEKDFPRENYDLETYTELVGALHDAKTLIEKGRFSASQIASARDAIDSAIDLLEYKSADCSKLEEIIEKAEALNADECNAVAYKMLMAIVDEAKLFLEDDDLKQSDVDDMAARVLERYREIVPEEEETEEETEESEEIIEETENNDETSDSTDMVIDKGCKATTLGSAAACILALAGGSVLVFKKKED